VVPLGCCRLLREKLKHLAPGDRVSSSGPSLPEYHRCLAAANATQRNLFLAGHPRASWPGPQVPSIESSCAAATANSNQRGDMSYTRYGRAQPRVSDSQLSVVPADCCHERADATITKVVYFWPDRPKKYWPVQNFVSQNFRPHLRPLSPPRGSTASSPRSLLLCSWASTTSIVRGYFCPSFLALS